MKKTILAAFAATAMMATPAMADIAGNWRTASGETAQISKCGGSFCIKLTTGKYAGKQIGKMKANGGKYVGSITDPTNDKTYSGSATVSGASMKMKGCALKVFCRTQTWNKK